MNSGRFHLFGKQDSVSEVQEFFKKHVIPLVGHRKPSNDAKRYTKRPLVVVYYGVDFSFDYRKGKFLVLRLTSLSLFNICHFN